MLHVGDYWHSLTVSGQRVIGYQGPGSDTVTATPEIVYSEVQVSLDFSKINLALTGTSSYFKLSVAFGLNWKIKLNGYYLTPDRPEQRLAFRYSDNLNPFSKSICLLCVT